MWEGVRDAAKKLLSVRKQKGKDGIEGKNTRRENELSDKISQEEDQLRWGRRKSIVPPPPLSPPCVPSFLLHGPGGARADVIELPLNRDSGLGLQ